MKRAARLFLVLFLLFEFFSHSAETDGFFYSAENPSLNTFEYDDFSSGFSLERTASKKKKNSKEDEEITAPITTIKVDKNKKKNSSGFFSRIDKNVLDLVENGSPETIAQAMAKMRKATIDYSEEERILIYICIEILKVVWASQNANIDYPQVTTKNAYIGAIESARAGLYDTSTGNKDFLSSLLPSLVLCGKSSRANYYEQARKDLTDALAYNGTSVLANYMLGFLLIKMGQAQEALPLLRLASEKSAAFEIHYNLALALSAMGRYTESSNITDRLIVTHPSNNNLLKLMAENAFMRSDYATAERYAQMVLTQNPSDLETVLFRAKVFIRTGEYLKAASLLDVYAKSNTSSKDYLILRAQVQKEWNKNIRGAITTMEKALSLYPSDYEVVLYAAELAGESGETVGGKTGAELSEQILRDDPENPAALSFLIRILIEAQRWSQAYNSSRKLMADNPSVQTVASHVTICLALGYNDEAWRNASSIYERLPNNETAIQTYVDAMVKTGRRAQASRFINAAIGNASSSMKSFYYYQRSFLAAGEADLLADLRSAIIANPRNSAALFKMYEIYFQKQDYRKAQYYLRQVIALNPNNATYLRLNNELDKLIM